MPLGTLPYKAKVTQANPDIDQGRTLLIQVFDGSSNFRGQFSIDVQDPTLQNTNDVQNIIFTMETAIIQQLIADAGDVGLGLQAYSLSAGG